MSDNVETADLQGPETGADHVAVAEASFKRCCLEERFLHAFYETLLASDPRIPPMFAATEFDHQAKLLQHAIMVLFIFARRGNPAVLDRLAKRHGRDDLDIAAEFYDLWTDALVATVEQHDAEFTPEVGEAWRQAVRPGVDFMIERY